MWYRYNRRGPRGMRYLWFLFIPLFLFAGHGGFFGILLWIGVIILLNIVGRAIFSSMASGSNRQNQWYQPRQQQPYQPPYQQNQYQQPYESYQQGYQQPYYQPSTEANQASVPQYQAPEQPQYDQYEQPQAEYPQELPPMQQ